MTEESIEKRGTHHKKKSSFFPLLFLFSILSLGTILGIQRLSNKTGNPTTSPVPQKTLLGIFDPFFKSKKDLEILKIQIEKETVDWNNYSIYVKDLKSDLRFDINKSVIFTGASINKIPILAGLYYFAQSGDIDLDQVITIQSEDIQDYGTGTIRYDPNGSTYTLRTLARLMMEKSDNTAAYILGRVVIGFPKLQQLLQSWGMTQTNMENNTTSNADMAYLIEKIYKGNIANEGYTKEILSFLANNEINDRLPLYLPKDVVVYHKTGNGVHLIHDVGIVKAPTTTYYIGIFTNVNNDEEETTALIGKISQIVYNFMK